MGAPVATYLLLLIVFIGLTAFFCSSETAYLALQKVRLEHLVNTNVKGARLVARMVAKPERLLSVVLLGINVSHGGGGAGDGARCRRLGEFRHLDSHRRRH